MCPLDSIFAISLFIFLYIAKLEADVKIWKPNNDIFAKENWVDPDLADDCGKVEFGEINTAGIFVDKLVAKEFVLPISGNIILLDGGYLELIRSTSKKKSNCLKLKELKWHHYLNPENWDSDVSKNPAVPDMEKIPCLFDKIKFPNSIYSGVYTAGVARTQTVSEIEFGNKTFENIEFDAFRASSVGSEVFDDFDSIGVHLTISPRICFDASGCTCNRANAIQCPPKKEIQCLSPVEPVGFCHKICGAFMTFNPKSGFSLARIRVLLKEYSNVITHVSKILDNRIQVVFAEEKYTGDSIIYARKFYEKLQKKSEEYNIDNLWQIRTSGSQTSGDSSLWMVVFGSLFFVVVLFGIIFYVYGDYKIPINIGQSSTPSLPLSSTYRARFSPREDESGLIFDNQSLAGSVMNLDQSFDNPMYGQVSTTPDINEDDRDIIYEPSAPKVETNQSEKSQSDPLYDLNRLNRELKEEMGTDIVQELPKSVNIDSTPLIDVDPTTPLVELDRENEEY